MEPADQPLDGGGRQRLAIDQQLIAEVELSLVDRRTELVLERQPLHHQLAHEALEEGDALRLALLAVARGGLGALGQCLLARAVEVGRVGDPHLAGQAELPLADRDRVLQPAQQTRGHLRRLVP